VATPVVNPHELMLDGERPGPPPHRVLTTASHGRIAIPPATMQM